ncbi:ATP-grasp domain-containing protein [Prevotella disiens]|uniref:ATP-grasp domain-containing protein n=1 Tax=Prevotella disiens TaxID=28130 RepID=UPI00242E9285|nr:ATP-grasp domain-containing protein [Prevotella disiens]
MEDNRILITAIGSFSADCVIRMLKKDGFYVVGTDIYPAEWHFESTLCNKVYQVPLATEGKSYIDYLLTIAKKENIKGIVPLTDIEIDIINIFRTKFEKLNITIYTQSAKTLSVARDKNKLSELFSKDDVVNVPKFIDSESLTMDFILPAIAKPINGRSSEGISKIQNKKQLSAFKGKANYLIQEFLEGNVCTVDYVRDSFGNDFLIPREELIRTQNGAGTTVRIFANKKINRIVSYIGNKIGVIGCVNMEFIMNDNKFYLIDINPRFSAGIAFSNLAGYDMVLNHIKAIKGLSIDKSCDFREQVLCKHYSEMLLVYKS